MDPTRLELSERVEKGFPVIDLDGEIDVYTVPRFKECLLKLIEEGHRQIIVNLSSVGYMDSSGFGALLGATKRLRPEGGKVGLVGCNQVISRMLKITRLNSIFELYESEEDAIQSFSAS